MQLKTLARLSLITLMTSLGPAVHAQRSPLAGNGCAESVNKKPIIDWAQFHFDSCHSGYNPYESILSPATVGNLVVDWISRRPADEIVASPAVAKGALYYGSAGANPAVYALDTRTGQGLWGSQAFYIHAGSPAVAYGRVYAVSYLDVRALDAATGQVLWEQNDPFYDIPLPEITVANGVVYVASYHVGTLHFGNVYALDANTGAVLWKLRMQDWNVTSPAVANGMVYVGCNSAMCALDAGTGTLLWRYPVGIPFPAAVSDGVVYFGALGGIANFYALNATTGTLVWQGILPSLIAPHATSLTTPAVANGIFYIGSASTDYPFDYLYALDVSTGAFLWSYRPADRIESSPAVANGVVYFGSDDMSIYAVDARTGVLLWQYTTASQVVSSPAVVNGTLYVGSLDSVYAFHLLN